MLITLTRFILNHVKPIFEEIINLMILPLVFPTKPTYYNLIYTFIFTQTIENNLNISATNPINYHSKAPQYDLPDLLGKQSR